ncbi:L-threonylcarbamoyladenylate synthase [Synechococcus sp. H70.2]|uniref:L-threonylcarbamoyladenylate synthase n=1 Tax=Synechococcus sp. H70.2 TaxID=2964528 RepID=UPI0039C18F28
MLKKEASPEAETGKTRSRCPQGRESPPMQTQILPPTPEHLALAAEALRQGQLVAMPTETVYGLAGHGLNEQAVAKIFAVKERPRFDPLILHLPAGIPLEGLEGKLVDLSAFTATARARLGSLVATFWPGPLTLVLPKGPQVPDLVTSGLPTVVLRVPAHPVAQALLQAVQVPLAAPSANRFGRLSPTSAQAVYAELAGRIPYILDGGECAVGVESTVLKLSPDGTPTLLRPGGIPLEVLASHLDLPLSSPPAPGSGERPEAPGQLSSHYAPGKPLWLLPVAFAQLQPEDWQQLRRSAVGHSHLGILSFAAKPEALAESLFRHWPEVAFTLECLGPDPNLAARGLFASLRRLDEGAATLLLAEPPPVVTGLGYAIMDRLRRASRLWKPPLSSLS